MKRTEYGLKRIEYGPDPHPNAARSIIVGLIISLPLWVVGFYLLLD